MSDHLLARCLLPALHSLGLLSCLSLATVAWCQAHPYEQLEGLQRFDKQAQLYSPGNPPQKLLSELDIKEVRIGSNVLNEAIMLNQQGGELHNVTGGTRSEKITVSFFQPYQEARLEQRLELYFNKNSGFIHQLNLRYLLSSAYLSIEPVREKVLAAALNKYGSPLTMQELRNKLNQPKGDIKMSDFVKTLEDTSPATLAYFKKMNITRKALITADQQDYALFHSGFDQCYLWPHDNYNELLSLCAFAPKAANAASRGLEFSLLNFAIAHSISEQQHQLADDAQLSL